FVVLEKELYAMAITPPRAPDPIAWLCPAFRINDAFAREIKAYSDLEITFFDQSDPRKINVLLATTFDGKEREALVSTLQERAFVPKQITDVSLNRERYVSYLLPLPKCSRCTFSSLKSRNWVMSRGRKASRIQSAMSRS